MEWLTTTLSGVGLALIAFGLYLAWPPLAFLVGGLVIVRAAWSLDGGDACSDDSWAAVKVGPFRSRTSGAGDST